MDRASLKDHRGRLLQRADPLPDSPVRHVGRPSTSESAAAQIRDALRGGEPKAEVARRLNVSYASVWYHAKRLGP